MSARGDSAQDSAAAVKFAWAGTYHSVTNRILRRYAGTVGLDPSFSVPDRGDAADLVDMVHHDLELTRVSRRFPKKDTCLAIDSKRVTTQRPLAGCLTESFPWCAQWHDQLERRFHAPPATGSRSLRPRTGRMLDVGAKLLDTR